MSDELEHTAGRFIGFLFLGAGAVLLVVLESGPGPRWGTGRGVVFAILLLAMGVGQIVNPQMLWGPAEDQQVWRRLAAVAALAFIAFWLL